MTRQSLKGIVVNQALPSLKVNLQSLFTSKKRDATCYIRYRVVYYEDMTTERSLTATGLPGKDETCKDDPFCIL